MKLTDRQELFCQEYIKDFSFNGTQAYLNAGYKVSRDVARVNSSKLLTKANIQERIQELMKATAETNKIEASKVLERITTIAFSEITDFLSVDKLGEGKEAIKYVNIKPSEEWPKEKIGAVSEVKQTKHGISLQLHSSPEMLKVLCEYLGLLKNQLNVSSEVKINQLDLSKLSNEEIKQLVRILEKTEEPEITDTSA